MHSSKIYAEIKIEKEKKNDQKILKNNIPLVSNLKERNHYLTQTKKNIFFVSNHSNFATLK